MTFMDRHQELKIWATKPKVEITIKRKEMQRDGVAIALQWLPHIFDHARLR